MYRGWIRPQIQTWFGKVRVARDHNSFIDFGVKDNEALDIGIDWGVVHPVAVVLVIVWFVFRSIQKRGGRAG